MRKLPRGMKPKSFLVDPTPSSHRTHLGPVAHSPGRLPAGVRRSAGTANGISPNGTPAQRQPIGNFGTHSVSRNGLSGYGMSAGMKVGRQQSGLPAGDHSLGLYQSTSILVTC